MKDLANFLKLQNLIIIGSFAAAIMPYSSAAECAYGDENADPQLQTPVKARKQYPFTPESPIKAGDQSLVRGILSSRTNSPCESPLKSVTESPQKSPLRAIQGSPTKSSESKGTISPQKGNARPVFNGIPRKLVFKKEEKGDKHLDHAIKIARQSKLEIVDNGKSGYLCALPDATSADLIESSISQLFKHIESERLTRIIQQRSLYTVFNFGLLEWSRERLFHMSFDGKKTKDMTQIDRERLKSVLMRVEFEFDRIETMNRFIAIRLKEPSAKKNCEVAPAEMEFLKEYLEYDGAQPCMHISLLMVNNYKAEMTCVQPQKKEMEVQLPNASVERKIKTCINLKQHFNAPELTKELSKVVLSYLYAISENTRHYVSCVPDSNKSDLFPSIYQQAVTFRNSLFNFPDIARLYFRKQFSIDYDFNGKIGICFGDIKSDSSDEDSVTRLFSKMFLYNDDTTNQNNNVFGSFQNVISFYIKNTLYRVFTKETEIANGRTIIDPDSFSFFDSSPEELTGEGKDLYREENRTDLLKIKSIEQNLCLHFIMNSFFGLSFDKSIFDQFYKENASLIDEVIKYDPLSQSRPLDLILSDLDKIVLLAVERNLLDTNYEVKRNFEFPDMYNKNVAPFIAFSEGTFQQLQQLIIQKVEHDIVTLEEAKGNVFQVTEFGTSKIPNTIFWHKFMHMIKEALPETMRGKKISFADLSAQPVEEDDDDR